MKCRFIYIYVYIICQSHYYVHFQTNTLGKGRNNLNPLLYIKQYHYCSSTRIALVLNKPRIPVCH